jgi:putative FmdB family regulatory protein
MPIYEYVCEACGKRSSALLARFSSPDPACPQCGEPSLQRQVSTFATVSSGESAGGDFGGMDGMDGMGGMDGDGMGGGDDFGGGGDFGDDDY